MEVDRLTWWRTRKRETRQQVIVETRWHGRLLAGLPDAITATFLAWTWAAPLEAGREAVLGGMALVGLEFPALLGLVGLFAAARSPKLLDKLRALILTAIALIMIGLLVQALYRSSSSAWPLLSIAWLLVGKWQLFATTRRDGTWFAEGIKLALQGAALLLILAIATDLPIPRWGFTEAAIRQLALPAQLFSGDHVQRTGFHPWQLFAGGSLYFAASALIRSLLASRREATRPPA